MEVDLKLYELFNMGSKNGDVCDFQIVSEPVAHNIILDRPTITHSKNLQMTLMPEMYDFQIMRMSGVLGTCLCSVTIFLH